MRNINCSKHPIILSLKSSMLLCYSYERIIYSLHILWSIRLFVKKLLIRELQDLKLSLPISCCYSWGGIVFASALSTLTRPRSALERYCKMGGVPSSYFFMLTTCSRKQMLRVYGRLHSTCCVIVAKRTQHTLTAAYRVRNIRLLQRSIHIQCTYSTCHMYIYVYYFINVTNKYHCTMQ